MNRNQVFGFLQSAKIDRTNEATVIIILLIQSINLKCVFPKFTIPEDNDLIANVCFCCRRYWQQGEVAHLVASAPVVVLYRPEQCQASLGEILHGVLHLVHCLDCCLLLLYGLDGESKRKPVYLSIMLT